MPAYDVPAGGIHMTRKTEKTADMVYRSSRRRFLNYLGAAPAFTTLAGAGLVSAPSALADTGPLDPSQRRHRAFVIRRDAAIYQRDVPPAPSVSNGDEDAYASRIASEEHTSE